MLSVLYLALKINEIALKVPGTLAHKYAKSTCAYLISIRKRVIASKMADYKLQLATDITLHIAFEEPALIKEMILKTHQNCC